MTKRKGQFEGSSQFISPLPLEVCYARLQALQDESISLRVTRENSDELHFDIQLLERGIVRVTGSGRLLRWEGTLTRVDCTIKVHEGILRWLLLFGLLFLLTMIALPLLLFLVAAVDVMIWVGISLIFILVLAGLMGIVNYYAPLDDTPENLLHLIINTLRS